MFPAWSTTFDVQRNICRNTAQNRVTACKRATEFPTIKIMQLYSPCNVLFYFQYTHNISHYIYRNNCVSQKRSDDASMIRAIVPCSMLCPEIKFEIIIKTKKILNKVPSKIINLFSTTLSRYDHLTELLAKLLAEQPRNAVDIFEEYSRKLKEERFKTKTDHLRDLYVPPVQYDDAKKLIKLFQVRFDK